MALAGGLCLVLAALGLAYLVAAIACVYWVGRPRRHDPVETSAPAITILKPLCGAVPELRQNLATFLRQDYAGAVRIVFGVQSPADPAIAIVEAMMREAPERDIRLVVDATLHGQNRKVSNLVNMAREVTGEIVVLADDDMRVPSDYLSRIVAVLADPAVGAVTCLYHGVPTGTRASDLARLGIDTHFLPNVAVGLATGMATPCFGSTIALRAETLARIGGFRAVANDLADDYEIGRRVRALGLSVVVPPFTIGHVCGETSLGDLAGQELRWARTIRQIDPAGHAGSLLSHPFPFAVMSLLLAPGAMSLAAVIAAIALRAFLCLAAERRFGLRAHPYWLIPARDVLSVGLLALSFAGRSVTWRGHSYGVDSLGALVPKPEP